MDDTRIYKVIFVNQGQVYEIYARHVSHGELLGFVEVEELMFGERSKLVVDPSEDRLKTEFEGVQRIFLPLHCVVRIDEVQKEGRGRIISRSEEGGKITPFPIPIYTPGGEPGKS